MFRWIDDKILAKYQKFTDFSQDWFGVTKFFWEKWAHISFSLMFGLFVVPTLLFSGSTLAVSVGIMFAIMIFLAIVSAIKAIESEEKAFLTRGIPEHRARHTYEYRIPSAIIWGVLFFLLFMSSELYLAMNTFCYISFLYFSACIPKPPSKSKARKLIAKAVTKLADSLPTNPQPA